MRTALTQRVACALAGAVLAAGGCLGRAPDVPPLTVSKETTYLVEPLRDDGTPDYAAWLEGRYSAGVTPENNAALVLREIEPEALLRLGVDPKAAPEVARIVGGMAKLAPLKQALEARADLGPLPPDFERAFTAQHRRALLAPWRREDAPLVAAWLTLNEATLARIEDVSRTRERWFVPLPALAFDSQLPSFLDFRLVSNALRCQALLALSRGDRARARRDVTAAFRLAALLEQGPWLIERLVAVAIRGSAAEAVIPMANPPPGPADARALLKELKALPPSAPIGEVLEVDARVLALGSWVDLYRAARRSPQAWQERMAALIATFTALNVGLGADPPAPVWRRIPGWAIDWDELFATLNRCWQNPACEAERASAKADLEPARLALLLAEARWQREARRRIARAFLGFQEPYTTLRTRVSWNEAEALRRLAVVSAAAAAERAERGRYPTEAGVLGDFETDHAGYSFAYVSDGRRFALSARPQKQNETGVRGYCADSSGRLAYAEDGSPPSLEAGLCEAGARVLASRDPGPPAQP